MAKRRKKSNQSNWSKLGSGRRSINSVAARVVGEGVRRPKHVELLETAKRTRNMDKRNLILAEAKVAEREYENRMTDKAAENRARKALARAQWSRQQSK